jgi:glycosyltransferase involved in cell wall biosynthesis
VRAVATALLTTYLSDYRLPLFTLLAQREGVEVLCRGGAERYAPPWFADLDAQLARAPFPARRLAPTASAAFAAARDHDAVIAPFAGGSMLPAAYLGARRYGRPFVLWASIWAEPRSLAHIAVRPLTHRIYRDADAVVAYGEHARRFIARWRGHDDDIFVAPQAVEPELFARTVSQAERDAFRAAHDLGDGPLVLYVGRLVAEKGVAVLLEAWRRARPQATLVVIGDGPLAPDARGQAGVRLLGPLPRPELPAAYASASLAVLASIPTPRFREPWGLVCNEAMHQGCPVLASTAVGAVAGGLVRHDETGWVVAPGDADALAGALAQLLGDAALRARLGDAARAAVAGHTPEAMARAFSRALGVARASHDLRIARRRRGRR